MSQPKRHHWWPQLNSGYWCDLHGNINVLNRDGTSFVGRPKGLGVVGHLYSKELEDGEHDTSIETWFASEVDGPFAGIIRKLIDRPSTLRRPFKGNSDTAATCKELGYRVFDYIEYYKVSAADMDVISKYVAALIVRNPKYIEKLEKFHQSELKPKNNALENMLYLYGVYANKIRKSDLILVKRDAEHEFLFSDGGIVAQEPWSKNGGMPFDIHFPLTPEYALQVFPAPTQFFSESIPLVRVSNKGVSLQNRIILANAQRQVFGRGKIPRDFVQKNWGRPAPKFIGHRHINGRMQTKVDWSRYYD